MRTSSQAKITLIFVLQTLNLVLNEIQIIIFGVRNPPKLFSIGFVSPEFITKSHGAIFPFFYFGPYEKNDAHDNTGKKQFFVS